MSGIEIINLLSNSIFMVRNGMRNLSPIKLFSLSYRENLKAYQTLYDFLLINISPSFLRNLIGKKEEGTKNTNFHLIKIF